MVGGVLKLAEGLYSWEEEEVEEEEEEEFFHHYKNDLKRHAHTPRNAGLCSWEECWIVPKMWDKGLWSDGALRND